MGLSQALGSGHPNAKPRVGTWPYRNRYGVEVSYLELCRGERFLHVYVQFLRVLIPLSIQ
jgi:hypothetical protein